MTLSPCLLLDASCLLNLFATGRLREIAATVHYQIAVADYVLEKEALYTWRADPDEFHVRRESVNLSPLVQEGLVRVMRLEHPDEELTFVTLAASIDDGEAITGALAFHRECSVATDDRKARRVLGDWIPSMRMLSTLELLKLWDQDGSVSEAELQAAMMSMRSGASFIPGYRDPLYGWWLEVTHSNGP